MRFYAVAQNTFRETQRDRVQWILLLYAIIVIMSAFVLSPLAMGEGYRVTRDLGLAALSIIGVVLIALVGGGLVQKEVERRTIHTILSKPVGRAEFLLGKYLGLLGMVTSMFLGMLAFLMLTLLIMEGRIEMAVLMAGFFTLGELAVLTAIVVAFSSFVSPVLSGIFTFAVFVFGHFSQDLLDFAEKAPAGVGFIARGIYAVIPHLHHFDLRSEAAYGVLPTFPQTLIAVVYGAAYLGAVLVVGSAILSRREFK
ncbi:MAG: ABC transporter permease subunit [Candidatus Eisenbacteria bacterium]|uniref:ABC transporter permease subunit n=1 Tax=Eiseniibacteriota bacterium TaxID=2212470 RepID=A0A7Y2E532_UNCEI|nr:ABC transporter permease subunit [Candidatus Eisenbacteria bacterium]